VSDGPTLRIVDEDDDDPGGAVPAPVPPDDDPEAWYAPDVRAQYESEPGSSPRSASATAAGSGTTCASRRCRGRRSRARPRPRPLLGVRHRRPLTRVGVIERAESGFEPKYERALDRLLDASRAARRRIDYHALRDLRLLGDVTPLALDGRIEVADVGDERELVVHTETFAPLETGIDADAEYVERVAAERLARYAVGFAGLSVEVVVARERLLGSDAFETKYAVREPDLLPGDEALIEECKQRIWETTVNGVVDDREAFVAEHARRFLSRRLTARNTRAWLGAAAHRARSALADRGLAVPPVDSRYAHDRLDDLAYYVLRDFVGEGILTVPIRDPNLEDVEANRVGERVKVVPRTSILQGSGRWGREFQRRRTTRPDEPRVRRRIDVRQRRHRAGGPRRDRAQRVDAVREGEPRRRRGRRDDPVCGGVTGHLGGRPHVSIRKQSADALTPVDLIDRGRSLPIWSPCCGCCTSTAGSSSSPGRPAWGKTTLLNAHTPSSRSTTGRCRSTRGLARSGSRTRPGCRSRRATTRTRTRP